MGKIGGIINSNVFGFDGRAFDDGLVGLFQKFVLLLPLKYLARHIWLTLLFLPLVSLSISSNPNLTISHFQLHSF